MPRVFIKQRQTLAIKEPNMFHIFYQSEANVIVSAALFHSSGCTVQPLQELDCKHQYTNQHINLGD